jgi:hypothetical protein
VHRFIWKTNGNFTERCLVERRGGNDGQYYADSGGIGDLRCDRAGDPDLPDEKEGSALIYFREISQATMVPACDSGLRAALPLVEATGDERDNGPEIEALFR